MFTTRFLQTHKVHLANSLLIGLCLTHTERVVCQNQKSQNPNVVIILADDLGYGDLGCYGATKVKTPNIDRLANMGCIFSDAHSASAVSTPSRYALMTGQYPFRKNVFNAATMKTGLLIDTNRLTIASLMKKSGYSTACIGKWHLGFGDVAPDWNKSLKPGPLELGFDYYYGVPVVNSHPPFVYVENHNVVGFDPTDPFIFDKKAETKEYPEKFDVDKIGGAKAAHALYVDELIGITLTQKAIKWVKDHKDTPFFLYFATTNIHHPFTPQPRLKGTSDIGRYGDSIEELDWIVGEIMKTLDDLNIADNTFFIFTSDNGGMLNQGGQDAFKAGHRNNGKLLGFKFDAWEGGHRIPFIVRWPGRIKEGSKSSQLICNVDMFATLAALTGYHLKPGDGPDSYNVLPIFLGKTRDQVRDHVVLAANNEQHLALRKDNWVYIGAQGGGGFTATNPGEHMLGGPAALKFTNEKNSDVEDGKIKPGAPEVQLYDLRADLYESRNVAREYPLIVKKMQEALKEIRQKQQTRPEDAGLLKSQPVLK